MVFAFKHHAWFAAVALAIHLAAGDQALSRRKTVIFKKKIIATIFLDQEWIGIEAVPRGAHDSETLIGNHFRDVRLHLHDNGPLLMEQTFRKFVAKDSHGPLPQKTRNAWVVQSARRFTLVDNNFRAQLHI